MTRVSSVRQTGTDQQQAARKPCRTQRADPRRRLPAVGHRPACFWQPLNRLPNRFAINLLELIQEPANINEREARLAEQLADEGAELARQAGLDAKSRAVEIGLPIDEAIVAHADQIDARLIVLGSRLRSSVASTLLGDIAHDVVQRSSRPVLLVPSPRLAARPADKRGTELPV